MATNILHEDIMLLLCYFIIECAETRKIQLQITISAVFQILQKL